MSHEIPPMLPTASIAQTLAYANSLTVWNAPGVLISLIGYNSKTSAQWVQVHDDAAVPPETAVPVYTFRVEESSNFFLEVPITGVPMSQGIMICNSSTGPTKTIGAADCFFTVVYRRS